MISCDGKLGVIFDFDGVLVDSGWAHRQAWHDLAEEEDLDMSDAFFSATFGMQNDTILPMLRPDITKGDLERLSNWKEQRYRDLVASRPEPGEGVMALLDDLKAKGFKMAIGSSAPRANVEVFRDALQLDRHVDVCVTKEQVSAGKPSPQTFLKAAELLSLPPACCAVVEDAVHGVEAGKAGGMPVVAVTTTRTREELVLADRVVDSLAELNGEDFLVLLGQET